jgi:hypothetical protein
MIGTVRKHQNWLWAIIITVIIISFVAFFSPNVKLGMTDDDGFYVGAIQNKPITREEFLQAQAEVYVMYRLRSGEWPRNDERTQGMLQDEIYSRLLWVKKLEDLKVHISPEATADMIATVFGSRGKPIEDYEAFVRDNLQGSRFTKDDLERLLRHELGRQHLISLFGLSGKLVTPQEAEFLFQRDNEALYVDAIFFNTSNYLSKVSVNETNLSQFYVQNLAQYRIPERVQVDYVQFDASNYLAKADADIATRTNLNQILESIYAQRGGTNYYKDSSGRGLSMEEAKPKIMEDARIELGLFEARKEAQLFINELFKAGEQGGKMDGALFGKVAEEQKRKVQTTPFLEQNHDLPGLDARFRTAAFQLSSDEKPFNDSPVMGEHAVYALAFKKRLPSEAPPFEKVKEKVREDYKMNEAARLAREAGDKFSFDLRNKLKEGRKLASVCAEYNVKAESLPSFSLSTRDLPAIKGRLTLDRLQNAVGRLTVGDNTDLMYAEDGGVVLHLRDRIPLSKDKAQAELQTYAKEISDQRQFVAFNHWLTQQAEEMHLVRPTREPAGPGQNPPPKPN